MNIMKPIPPLTWNGTLTPRTSTDFLILHHAEAVHCTVYDIQEWHKAKGWIGFGYNFFIDKLGRIIEGRPFTMSDADAYGHNYDSISCCFEGDFDKEVMTNPQVVSGIDLIVYCLTAYPNIRIVRHRDLCPTACPGINFRDDIITNGIKKYTDSKIIDPFDGIIDKAFAAKKIVDPVFWKTHAVAGQLIAGDLVRKLIDILYS